MELLKYFFLLLPLSLSNIGFVSSFRITFADIWVFMLITFVLCIRRKLQISNFLVYSILFFMLLYIISIFNIILVEDLHINKVVLNCFKMIFYTFIILTFPILIQQDKLKTVFKSLLLIIVFHSVVFIVDAIIGLPFSMEGHMIVFDGSFGPDYRPNGLFGEPSFFGIYTIMYLGIIMQFEINSKTKIIKLWHVILICIALFLIKSVTCYLAFLFLMTYYSYKNFTYKIVLFTGCVIFLMSISSFVEIDIRGFDNKEKETFLNANFIGKIFHTFGYFKERFSNFLTNNDGSSHQRVLGSFLYVLKVIEERPILGSGLGGDNLSLIFKNKNFYSLDYLVNNNFLLIPVTYSTSTFYSHLIGAGGILSLLFFYFVILGQILLNKETLFYGIILLLLGFSSGGFLDLQTWVCFAFCVVLQKKIKTKI